MVEEVVRNRQSLGELKSFYDLPIEKQEIYKKIKTVIGEEYPKVYVFGSHLWGNWDEYSDYDILIDDATPDGIIKYKKIFEDIFDFKVDINGKNFINGDFQILVP